MKKVCFVLPSLAAGGMERVAVRLAEFFRENYQAEVSFINFFKLEPFYTLSDDIKIYEPEDVLNKGNKIISLLKVSSFIRRQLKKIKPDVVISFGEHFNGFVLLASLFTSAKVFVSNRAAPRISFTSYLKFVNPLTYKFAEGIVVQTEMAKQILSSKYNSQKISVIGNPFFLPEKKSLPDNNIILMLGRFIKSKHQDLMLEYFSKTKDWKNWKLVFVGDGPEFDKVKSKCSGMEINNNVVFEGRQKDVQKYYNEASFFVFPSSKEGFPNSLGEAIASGLPAISFNCESGPADLIEDGVNGYLTDVFDGETFVDGMDKLMESRDLRESFSEAAYKKMTQFSMDSIGNKFAELIKISKQG